MYEKLHRGLEARRAISWYLVRWLRLTGWSTGSNPVEIVVLASASVICQMTGEALASNRKEVGMPIAHKPITILRRVISALFVVGAGVGANWIAGGLPAPA